MAAIAKVGVPITLLREGEGHVVTIEMKNGQIYRGKLQETEETMNCALKDVTSTARDGKVSKLEQVYVRGSYVKYVVLPDVLKNAPIFKGVQKMASNYNGPWMTGRGSRGSKGRGRGLGRGRGPTPSERPMRVGIGETLIGTLQTSVSYMA